MHPQPYSLDTSPKLWSSECLQTLSNVPWVTKPPQLRIIYLEWQISSSLLRPDFLKLRGYSHSIKLIYCLSQFYWDIIDLQHCICIRRTKWWFDSRVLWDDWHSKKLANLKCLCRPGCSVISVMCSPSGSSVHGILQARILECDPGIFPDPGIKPASSSVLHTDSLLLSHQGRPLKCSVQWDLVPSQCGNHHLCLVPNMFISPKGNPVPTEQSLSTQPPHPHHPLALETTGLLSVSHIPSFPQDYWFWELVWQPWFSKCPQAWTFLFPSSLSSLASLRETYTTGSSQNRTTDRTHLDPAALLGQEGPLGNTWVVVAQSWEHGGDWRHLGWWIQVIGVLGPMTWGMKWGAQ